MLFDGLFGRKSTTVAVDKDGVVDVGVSHSLHGSAVLKGNVFSGATAASGVAPGTALGTTGAYTLVNPLGSDVYGVVLQGGMGYVSGTLGAGFVSWNATVNPQLALPTGTGITAVNMLIGGRRNGASLLPLTTSTIVAPVIIRPAWNLDASLATTAGVGAFAVTDHVNGSIVVAPGASVTLHGTSAAGATPLVVFGSIWEEVSV